MRNTMRSIFTLMQIMGMAYLLSGSGGVQAAGISKGGAVDLADFYSQASPTSGIQEAIDALPPEGGLVTLPPGTYLLKRSIRVKDNVTLRGSGPSTILMKCKGVHTRLSATGPKGSRALDVESVAGFEQGMQICVKSKEWSGFNCSQPVIAGISGNALNLNGPLEHEYDTGTTIVVNYFPAIWIEGKSNVLISDITIDGDIENNREDFQDFVTAAIHSVHSPNLTIRETVVRNWPSDGIGVQGGSDVLVTGCRVYGCRGQGFHPGTLLEHSVFSNLVSHDNTGDGFYFCWFVKNISVSNGIFYRNGRHGIGGLGGKPGPDAHNIVTNNVCESNGQCGIQGIEGSDFIISNNIVRNNSQSSPGTYPGILLRDCSRMLVNGNLCYDDQPDGKKTQKCGIEETREGSQNKFFSNHSWGNIIGDIIQME